MKMYAGPYEEYCVTRPRRRYTGGNKQVDYVNEDGGVVSQIVQTKTSRVKKPKASKGIPLNEFTI